MIPLFGANFGQHIWQTQINNQYGILLLEIITIFKKKTKNN